MALLAACVFLLTTLGCRKLLSGYAEGESARLSSWEREGNVAGQERFLFDDLGGLNTHTMDSHALPWKVVAASLVLWDTAEQQRTAPRTVGEILGDFGFIAPHTIANWAGARAQPEFDRPLGLVGGQVTRGVPPVSIEVVNLGCASCHAGVTYDATGAPRPQVWLGLPNTSLDLDRYTRGVFEALRFALQDPPRLLREVDRLFPEITSRERVSLERYVVPRSTRRIAQLDELGAPTVFPGGSPGVTNGVGALKSELGLLDPKVRADEFGFTSIPDLAHRSLRSSLLVDGAYAPRGRERFVEILAAELAPERAEILAPIAAFFTVPTMGVAPGEVPAAVESMVEILEFLADYEPPAFPGPIDLVAAERGSSTYAARCAECHGRYSPGVEDVRLLSFPNRLSPQEEMGTDPLRWQAIDRALVDAIDTSKYGGHLAATTTGGYVGTLLSGVWATAPYLHNGSVPTLWHVLFPQARPERFEVGGHALDFRYVGVALAREVEGTLRYDAAYRPWSTPQIYDTTQPGRSNRGHEKEFVELSVAERLELIEYLKLL